MIWAVPCQSSSTDSQSNTISLFNVVERVEFTPDDSALFEKNLPSDGAPINLNLEIVSLMARTDLKELQVLNVVGKVTLSDPDEKILLEAPIEGVMNKNDRRLRLGLRFGGIKVTKSGIYSFTLWIKESSEKDFYIGAVVPIEIQINLNKRD